MPNDPAWINADLGTPEYNARELRRLDATGMFPGVLDRFGARSGVRPGGLDAVTIAGTTVTVRDLCAVVYTGAGGTQTGPYRVALQEETHELDPADAINDRIDAIDLQVQDDAEDSSTFRRARSVYVPGVPAADPDPPALTENAFRLATVLVPAGGITSPSVTYVAPFIVALGGILPVRGSSELPTVGRYEGMYADDRGDEDALKRWSGSAWEKIATPSGYALLAAMLGLQSDFAAGAQTADTSALNTLPGGPSVTVDIGPSGRALVFWGHRVDFSSTSPGVLFRMGIDMSGANAGAVAGTSVVNATRQSTGTSANYQSKHTVHMETELSQGSTTFTAEYAISTGTATVDNRILIVIPL